MNVSYTDVRTNVRLAELVLPEGSNQPQDQKNDQKGYQDAATIARPPRPARPKPTSAPTEGGDHNHDQQDEHYESHEIIVPFNGGLKPFLGPLDKPFVRIGRSPGSFSQISYKRAKLPPNHPRWLKV